MQQSFSQKRRTELSPVAKAFGDDGSLGAIIATPKRAMHYNPGIPSTQSATSTFPMTTSNPVQTSPQTERQRIFQTQPQLRPKYFMSPSQNLTERALQTPITNPVSPPSYRLSLSPAASVQDTGGFLSITSDDDLWLPRYTEPIPLQSEDRFKEMSDRIDSILKCPITPNVKPLNPRASDQLSTSPYGSLYGNDENEMNDGGISLSYVGDSNEKAWGEGPGVPGGEDDSTIRRSRNSSQYDRPYKGGYGGESDEDEYDDGGSSSGSSSNESLCDSNGYERSTGYGRRGLRISADIDPYSTGYSVGSRMKGNANNSEDEDEDDEEVDDDINDVEYAESDNSPDASEDDEDDEANGYDASYRRAVTKTPSPENDLGGGGSSDDDDPYSAPYKGRINSSDGYSASYATVKRKQKATPGKPKVVKTQEIKPANPLARGTIKINLENLPKTEKKPAKRSPHIHEVLDWNKKFQESISNIGKLTLNTHSEYRYEAYKSLSSLAADFSFEVKTYAKIIISEVYLPNDKKTIKPIRESTGEYGDKYIVGKIMFKFASDIKGIYGSDENAARIANHDLRSLVHVLNCWEPDVHVPMMTLVDYRGFRVVGMSFLPINHQTIIHGSSDNGKTIYESTALNERLSSIAYKLNLKTHYVGEGENRHSFCTPVDLEGHMGTDGKYYLINFSHLFPPQYLETVPGGHNNHQVLRPELVRTFHAPLSSDALTEYDQSPKNFSDVVDATRYISTELVPKFAKKLIQVPPEKRDKFELILMLHASGINVRFLGELYTEVKRLGSEYWCLRLTIEMCARVIKNDIRALMRQKMREMCLPGESAYRTLVVRRLNRIFGNSIDTMKYWMSSIRKEIITRFPPFSVSSKEDLLQWISATSKRLGMVDGRCVLLRFVSHMLGLRFADTTWQEMLQDSTAFDRAEPFTDTDLTEIRVRVKEMNIAAHSAGFMLKVKAKMTDNAEERRRMLSLAIGQFHQALEGNPDNKVTLRNLGECHVSLNDYEEGLKCYIRALNAGPNDTTTLFKYAIALDKAGRLDEAEKYFLQSLEACPTHSNCCYHYADFLCYHRKNFVDARRFYERSLEIDPFNRSAANNFAVFLATMVRSYDEAEKYFQRAVSSSSNYVHMENYAAFLKYIRNDPEKAKVYSEKAKECRIKIDI